MSTSVIRKLTSRTLTSKHNFFRTKSTSIDSYGYDLVVVGGGIVGTATAREMKARHPKLRIAMVEKEACLGLHQTTRNSGVIHAGIYYTPGSLKAKLCVEGSQLAYEYMCKNDIPHKKAGKLIVAQNQEEVDRLIALYKRACENNCPDIELVEKENISNYSANCKGEKAIWSPQTGIVDWSVVCQHLASDFKKMGGKIFLNFEVTGFAESLESKDKDELLPISIFSKDNKYLNAKYVLTCAGLYSDRLAVMTGCDKAPQIIPFRGEFLLLRDDKKSLVNTNIYQLPKPNLPFLGVHFTPKINGDVWVGPNAVLCLAREGYSWRDINIKDCIEMLKYPGLWKLGIKYIVPGITEITKSIFYQLTVKDLQKLIPSIKTSDLKRGPAGVRAQALDKNGNLVDDFVFDNGVGKLGSRVLHCRNAPSPGATSSLAIAKFISDKLEKDFKF